MRKPSPQSEPSQRVLLIREWWPPFEEDETLFDAVLKATAATAEWFAGHAKP